MKIHIYLFLLVSWQQAKSAIIQGNVGNRNVGLSKVGSDSPDNFEGPLNNFTPDRRGKNDDNRESEFERNGYEFDVGNPDIHGEIKRPCEVYDTFCIQKFFAEHSHCKISGRNLPDPLYRAQHSVSVGSANMTSTQVNSDFGGLNNARISEFYINKVTDNLVIAITFDSASKYSNNTYFKYYLRGREPVVTRDFGGIQYGVLTITVVIPDINDLRLDRSEIYTYGDTNIYPLVLGPGLAESTDPEVATMYARFYTNIPNEYQEEMAAIGEFIVANYIQYNICDFGLKVLCEWECQRVIGMAIPSNSYYGANYENIKKSAAIQCACAKYGPVPKMAHDQNFILYNRSN